MTEVISVINPATGEFLQDVPVDEAGAIAQKVSRARQAQPAWAATRLSDRMAPIQRFRDLLTERADSLAALLTSETGKPITQARNEILATPRRINFFLEHAPAVLSANLVYREPGAALPGVGKLEEVLGYDPLGVVANISAWNYPYFVGSNVFVPALLMGNAVLYKPSEVAALTGMAIAQLLHEAGIPEDIFIPVIGAGKAGAALLEQPLDGVFFTGSYATGKKIAIAAAPQLMRVQLELGGKDPAYVCNDVDVAIAAANLADGAFYNNGQSCCAIERIYVHASIFDGFMDAFMAELQSFKLGDPTQPDTYFGPLSRQPQLDVLTHQVEDALSKGAKRLCGGQRLEQPGWYFAPTVLTEVTHDMAVMREETFGPVIGIQKVPDDETAMRLMQDTDYGLTAAVYSKNRDRAVSILQQIKSGTAYWNCCDRVSPHLPWSGRGHSGVGATLSLAGMYAFLHPRAWHLKRP